MCGEKLRIAIPAPLSQIPNYMAAMRALGAEPVPADADCDPEAFDGLLLPGGTDIEPWRYHQRDIACKNPDPDLDALQFAALDSFVKMKKPVFGICRGHQLINVYFGGTLIQHIDCADRHARAADSDPEKVHINSCESGSFLAELYGTKFCTNSSHHQAVDRPAEKMRVVMRSEEGIIEAMFHEELPVWSVQWHPERMCFRFRSDAFVDGRLVLQWFLDRCMDAKKR